MKAILLILAAGSLVAVPVVATVANQTKTQATSAQLAPAAVPAAEQPRVATAERQPGGFMATFVVGSPDVAGQSFPLNPVAPILGTESAAWQGSFNSAFGPVSIRVGAWSVWTWVGPAFSFVWSAGGLNTNTIQGDVFGNANGVAGAVNCTMYSVPDPTRPRERTRGSWGMSRVN